MSPPPPNAGREAGNPDPNPPLADALDPSEPKPPPPKAPNPPVGAAEEPKALPPAPLDAPNGADEPNAAPVVAAPEPNTGAADDVEPNAGRAEPMPPIPPIPPPNAIWAIFGATPVGKLLTAGVEPNDDRPNPAPNGLLDGTPPNGDAAAGAPPKGEADAPPNGPPPAEAELPNGPLDEPPEANGLLFVVGAAELPNGCDEPKAAVGAAGCDAKRFVPVDDKLVAGVPNMFENAAVAELAGAFVDGVAKRLPLVPVVAEEDVVPKRFVGDAPKRLPPNAPPPDEAVPKAGAAVDAAGVDPNRLLGVDANRLVDVVEVVPKRLPPAAAAGVDPKRLVELDGPLLAAAPNKFEPVEVAGVAVDPKRFVLVDEVVVDPNNPPVEAVEPNNPPVEVDALEPNRPPPVEDEVEPKRLPLVVVDVAGEAVEPNNPPVAEEVEQNKLLPVEADEEEPNRLLPVDENRPPAVAAVAADVEDESGAVALVVDPNRLEVDAGAEVDVAGIDPNNPPLVVDELLADELDEPKPSAEPKEPNPSDGVAAGFESGTALSRSASCLKIPVDGGRVIEPSLSPPSVLDASFGASSLGLAEAFGVLGAVSAPSAAAASAAAAMGAVENERDGFGGVVVAVADGAVFARTGEVEAASLDATGTNGEVGLVASVDGTLGVILGDGGVTLIILLNGVAVDEEERTGAVADGLMRGGFVDDGEVVAAEVLLPKAKVDGVLDDEADLPKSKPAPVLGEANENEPDEEVEDDDADEDDEDDAALENENEGADEDDAADVDDELVEEAELPNANPPKAGALVVDADAPVEAPKPNPETTGFSFSFSFSFALTAGAAASLVVVAGVAAVADPNEPKLNPLADGLVAAVAAVVDGAVVEVADEVVALDPKPNDGALVGRLNPLAGTEAFVAVAAGVLSLGLTASNAGSFGAGVIGFIRNGGSSSDPGASSSSLE